MAEESVNENVLPEELANISFDELQDLYRKCKLKKYSELRSKKKSHDEKREFRRENKNRPREISSKITCEMSSKIPPFKNLTKEIRKKIKTEKPVDPRFHDRFGEFNQIGFDRHYKFLNNIKNKEKKKLKEKLRNPQLCDEERDKIKKQIQRIDNQRKEEARKKQESKLKTEEREYEMEQLKQGYKPKYCKKTDEKLLNLVRQFETMKEKGGLQKHIKRRRKKTLSKDKRKLSVINNI